MQKAVVELSTGNFRFCVFCKTATKATFVHISGVRESFGKKSCEGFESHEKRHVKHLRETDVRQWVCDVRFCSSSLQEADTISSRYENHGKLTDGWSYRRKASRNTKRKSMFWCHLVMSFQTHDDCGRWDRTVLRQLNSAVSSRQRERMLDACNPQNRSLCFWKRKHFSSLKLLDMGYVIIR